MKFLDLLRMSSGSLWKRKVRTVLTILGVIIGTASIVVMLSLGLGLNKSTMDSMEQFGGLTTITVYQQGYYSYMPEEETTEEVKHLNDELVESLKQLPHVESAYPVLEISAMAFSGQYENYLQIRGIDLDVLREQNLEFAEGGIPEESNGELQFIFGNEVLAGFNNPTTGSGYWWNGELADIDLMNDTVYTIIDMDRYYQAMYPAEDGQQVPPPKKRIVEAAGLIAGSVDEYSAHSYYTYCDIEALKAVLKRDFKGRTIPGQPTTKTGKPYKEIYYNQIVVNADHIDNTTDLQTQITAMGYDAQSNAEWIQSQQQQLGIIQMVLGGIGAVSLLVAAIGITNTMMMSIYERTKEIGIMKVLGCDLRNIQGLFLIEAGFIGLIGGVIGLIFSYALSGIINFLVMNSQMGSDMGLSGGISYIPPWLALLSIIFAVLVGMVAGFFPSLRAMRLSPLAAIRNE